MAAVNPPEHEQLLRDLSQMVQDSVAAAVRQAKADAPTVQVVPGWVLEVEGPYCLVNMDDGGITDEGRMQCVRMSGVVAGSRVRVHFFPSASPEAHKVDGI